MIAYVVIATKGRPEDVAKLEEILRRQTTKPEKVIYVGTCDEDFGDAISEKQCPTSEFLISEKAGLPAQRNVGIEYILKLNKNNDNFIVVYFSRKLGFFSFFNG